MNKMLDQRRHRSMRQSNVSQAHHSSLTKPIMPTLLIPTRAPSPTKKQEVKEKEKPKSASLSSTVNSHLVKISKVKPIALLLSSTKTTIHSLIFCIIFGLIFLLSLRYNSLLASDLIAILYPAFHSLNEKKDAIWSLYWAILGLMHLFEHFCWMFSSVISYYAVLKIVFVIWLMAPRTRVQMN